MYLFSYLDIFNVTARTALTLESTAPGDGPNLNIVRIESNSVLCVWKPITVRSEAKLCA